MCCASAQSWDLSYTLENLSGRIGDCSMVDASGGDWDFATADRLVAPLGIRVTGRFGVAANDGNTQTAIEGILRRIRAVGASNFLPVIN